MGATRDWKDEYTLLCEGCGYPLGDLYEEGACPECGRPIRSSLALARQGSAWQRSPSTFAWLATGWGVLRRPGRTFESIRVGAGESRRLAFINSVLSSLIMISLPIVRMFLSRHPIVPWTPWRFRPLQDPLVVPMLIAVVMLTTASILLMTWIESAGVRFFGQRRGKRITPAIAWNVCSHATYGWVIGALLFTLGWSAVDISLYLSRELSGPSLWARYGDGVALLPAAGLFVGMMLFEYRVYQGIAKCRFANTPLAEENAAA